jgi:tRNA threonylcarbamoyl adenosine modification protein YeaZ
MFVMDTSQGTTSLACAHAEVIHPPFVAHAPQQQAAQLLHYSEEYRQHCGVAWEELQAVGCITGVGGFTSVRIGVAAARGLALVLGIPAYGMSLLEVMAWWAWQQHQLQESLCVLPAGTQYAVWQSFKEGVAVQPMQVVGMTEYNALIAANPHTVVSLHEQGSLLFPIGEAASTALHKWMAVGTEGYPAPEPLYARPPDAKVGMPLLRG